MYFSQDTTVGEVLVIHELLHAFVAWAKTRQPVKRLQTEWPQGVCRLLRLER